MTTRWTGAGIRVTPLLATQLHCTYLYRARAPVSPTRWYYRTPGFGIAFGDPNPCA
jgi:hypothetical protein